MRGKCSYVKKSYVDIKSCLLYKYTPKYMYLYDLKFSSFPVNY